MEETQLILSVIIPMYNCAPVIERCLDSIDYAGAEIIVVNDGSTDDSLNVVQEYIVRMKELGNERIRVISKPNGGVSSARNLGIENAQGKYISFIDADDYIVKGGLERIVQIAEEYDADVVKYKNKSVKEGEPHDDSSVSGQSVQIIETNGEDVLNRYDLSDYIVWDGIYRREMITKHHLRFMTDLNLHEDDVFMGMVYCHAKKVIVTDLLLYRYVIASNYSSTHRQTIEKQLKLITSGLKAMQYRSSYVQQYYPKAMGLERLKYMRWVCSVRSAVEVGMSYKEYQSLLKKYHAEGTYPLQYKWIKVAGRDYSIKLYTKHLIRTVLTNHPWIGYPIEKLIHRK